MNNGNNIKKNPDYLYFSVATMIYGQGTGFRSCRDLNIRIIYNSPSLNFSNPSDWWNGQNSFNYTIPIDMTSVCDRSPDFREFSSKKTLTRIIIELRK
jgi:hypothetical protein